MLKNPSASFNTLQTVQSTDCFTSHPGQLGQVMRTDRQ